MTTRTQGLPTCLLAKPQRLLSSTHQSSPGTVEPKGRGWAVTQGSWLGRALLFSAQGFRGCPQRWHPAGWQGNSHSRVLQAGPKGHDTSSTSTSQARSRSHGQAWPHLRLRDTVQPCAQDKEETAPDLDQGDPWDVQFKLRPYTRESCHHGTIGQTRMGMEGHLISGSKSRQRQANENMFSYFPCFLKKKPETPKTKKKKNKKEKRKAWCTAFSTPWFYFSSLAISRRSFTQRSHFGWLLSSFATMTHGEPPSTEPVPTDGHELFQSFTLANSSTSHAVQTSF